MSRRRLNAAQKEAVARYEGLTAFEFMHLDDFRAGRMTFREAWRQNMTWFEHLCADVQNIPTRGLFDNEPEENAREHA